MGYQLQQRLGRGGMGVVDLALDERGQPVALKRLALYGSAVEIGKARTRVRREAEALSRLRHPHVVPLLGAIDDGDDLVLVMPYLAGGTLADQVRAYGALRPDQVLALAGPLFEALAYAHGQGVVHRDLKPANVLFDLDGRPYLGDFGIATFRDATSGLTATGAILGTPDFMAPEQARGERSTPATDVFALAATLLFGATAGRPYGTADARLAIARAADGKVEPLPTTLDPRLARLLKPALRPNPDKRPSAAELAAQARTLAAPDRRSTRRAGRVVLAGALVLGMAMMTIAGWQYARGSDTRTAGPSTTALAAAPTVPASAPRCTDLPYQPCGAPAAPHTDGSRCTGDHADYDGNAANGCEASPDTADGQRLERSLTANLVPNDDTDRYPFHVGDDFSLTCDGRVVVTLTSAPGTSMKLDVVDASRRSRGSAVSKDGVPARVTLTEPTCGGDDSVDLTAVVSYEPGSGRSASRYTLARSGSF